MLTNPEHMPVYSSHLVDYRGLGVGRRIRDERQKRKMTLRQLAGAIFVSEAKLSNIENDKVSLDLGELERLAKALDIHLGAFFPRTTVQHYLIKRGHEVESEAPTSRDLVGPEPGPSKHHNCIWPLANTFVGKHIEPVLAQIRPLPAGELNYIVHDHEEFMFVLKGSVDVSLKTNDGVVTESLAAGDSIYFRSHLPHCNRSTGPTPADALNVFYSLRGAIDPGDGEFRAPGRRFYRRAVYADAPREASEKIGLLRRSYGLTLVDLANEIGIGARQLAQVEAGEKAADIDILLRLARRFRRPIEYFFSTTLESQPYHFIQRGSDMKDVAIHRWCSEPGRAGGDVYRPLALGFPDRGVHPCYVQLATAAGERVAPHEHPGEEFVYVLEGELEFVTYGPDEHVEVLYPGDSLFLDSSVPHSLRGRSRNPYATTNAELIEVFWTPLDNSQLFVRDEAAAPDRPDRRSANLPLTLLQKGRDAGR
jgi:transcriptional regulator with XRE-family HTH domain/quercetin dioxygenase-like cupin family protein